MSRPAQGDSRQLEKSRIEASLDKNRIEACRNDLRDAVVRMAALSAGYQLEDEDVLNVLPTLGEAAMLLDDIARLAEEGQR